MTKAIELPGGATVSGGQLAVVLGALVTLAIPQFAGSYWTNIGIDVMTVALFALSFNLVFGYTGLLSFGHAAFFGTAAYTVAITLSAPLPWVPQIGSFIPALLLGMAMAGFVAAVFGAFCVQRSEIFFAMLTLAFNMLLYEIAVQWEALTGGVNGTTLPGPTVDLVVMQFSVLNKTMYYYLVFVCLAISTVVLYRVVKSPYGELLRAIRENPERAEFVGMPVKWYQWSSFIISGTFAGLAGGLAAVQTFVVSPTVLHWSESAVPVLSTLLGGPTVFMGPIVGGIIYVGLEVLFTQFTQYWQFGVGLVLIPIVLFIPGGLLGYLFDKEGMGAAASIKHRLGLDTEEEQ